MPGMDEDQYICEKADNDGPVGDDARIFAHRHVWERQDRENPKEEKNADVKKNTTSFHERTAYSASKEDCSKRMKQRALYLMVDRDKKIAGVGFRIWRALRALAISSVRGENSVGAVSVYLDTFDPPHWTHHSDSITKILRSLQWL
jgi:hypothetical protein